METSPEKTQLLILGASGLLGGRLHEYFSRQDGYKTLGTCLKKQKEGLFKLDICDRAEMLKFFKERNPEIVIHAAGLTNVNYCELNKVKANSVNVLGSINIIECCKQANSKLICISTDFVFSGAKNTPYTELDKPAEKPLNYYAETKLLAEELIRKSSLEYLIARTSTLYSVGSNDFVNWAINELKQKRKIKVACNHIRSPTFAEDIPIAIDNLIKKGLFGIYHIAGPRALSKYGMALEMTEMFCLDERLIAPVHSKILDEPAIRPEKTALNITKLKCEGIKMSDFKEGLFNILIKK